MQTVTMWKVTIIVLSVLVSVLTQECTEQSTLLAVKKPLYEFSVRLLDRVATQTTSHFVYSPLSTWLQLLALARGAKSRSQKEILNVTGITGYRRKSCYRKKLRNIINNMEENLTVDSERSSIIIVDKFYPVKPTFKREVEALVKTRILSLDFDKPDKSADEANEVIKEETRGFVEALLEPEDFDKNVLLMTDAAYFKNAWKYPFNDKQTKLQNFYSSKGVPIGTVNMMNQIGYFKYAEIPLINARVVELPCEDDRVSMLVFLPIKDDITDLFYNMKRTTLTGVLNMLKMEGERPMNVSLPRFTINSELSNVIELLFDMGVKRIFYPEFAELKGISDYTINVSLMTQLSAIEVTESYVAAASGPESFIQDSPTDFNADNPFGFVLFDWKTEMIMFAEFTAERPFGMVIVETNTDIVLFSGMFSEPSFTLSDYDSISI